MLGLAPLISGGVSLLSGLFGQSSAKKQAKKEEAAIAAANKKAEQLATDMNTQVRARADAAALKPIEHQTYSASASGVDMPAFMAAAKAGGFNPLTFLRAGMGSMFGKTENFQDECTWGTGNMEAALAGQYIPQLSPVISQTRVPGTGEIIGNALTAGTNQYLSDMSAERDFANQKALLGMQLAGRNMAGAYAGPRSFYTPTAVGSGSAVSKSGGGGAVGSGYAQEFAGERPAVGGRSLLVNNKWPTNDNFVDADWWEQRYSDPGGWIGGAINLTADAAKNWRGFPNPITSPGLGYDPGKFAAPITGTIDTIMRAVRPSPGPENYDFSQGIYSW